MMRRVSSKAAFAATVVQQRWSTAKNKQVTADDAAFLVPDGATLSVGGFGAHNAPEEVLEAIGRRFKETGHPKDLQMVMAGGPGDYATRGINHLAQKGCVRRFIASFYGQTPPVADMAMQGVAEAYKIPLGVVSRMIRSAAAGQPCYITDIGIGTMVDPRNGGGKINSITTEDIIKDIVIDGKRYLTYPAIPIDVALVRGTTGDPAGNITCEHESVVSDNMILAMAARSTRGLTICQVNWMAADGTLHPRDVKIPGTMVDCVVPVTKKENSHQSYFLDYHPGVTGEIRTPPTLSTVKLDERKVIGRRAALELVPGNVVNLGIGMPEWVAKVADEEHILQYIELTTECGMHGGVGLSGHNFGPAYNYNAIIQLNQQFDFYNGGGLDVAFLGMAQVSEAGDVNVSQVGPMLKGPGGFIDITQSTKRLCFLGSLTQGKGRSVKIDGDKGRLVVENEGKSKKFLKKVDEITFSGKAAIDRGQNITYITERCVFKLTKDQKLMLVEIAPGMTVEKDVLPYMEFTPLISPTLKSVPEMVYKKELMQLKARISGLRMNERLFYNSVKHTVYINLEQLAIHTPDTMNQFVEAVIEYFEDLIQKTEDKDPLVKPGKPNVVVNYGGFDIHPALQAEFEEAAAKVQQKYYGTVRRYSSRAFNRHKAEAQLQITTNVDDSLNSLSADEALSALHQLGLIDLPKDRFTVLFDAVAHDGKIPSTAIHQLYDSLA